ncbi:exodeoxyribonuclease VII small subunit [Anaerovorax odorimutans]|uniref:exodeoxyribonuclease VII small subunit n=1 Tax=Anaerovorax odorimutans TaxID=109327 RepID=UPI00042A6128|nr:exodeoxyribonuclease VII small subunit [Anaerovorax odorimutans]
MAIKTKESDVSNLTFEEALEKLEKSAEALKKDGYSLEDAMKNFEEGIEYYNYCNKILTMAKQKIEVYNKNQ